MDPDNPPALKDGCPPCMAKKRKTSCYYPATPVALMAEAYSRAATFGEAKHGNVATTPPACEARVFYAKVLRHLDKLMNGQCCDEESGLSHADHLLWNVAQLLKLNKDNDHE